MSTIAEPTRLTPAQYLAFERASEHRHEFIDGALTLMSGASRNHDKIIYNIVRVIDPLLLDRPGDYFSASMRVRAGVSCFYPDLTVVADEPRFEDDTFDTLVNPAILVEVLSPSTEALDRGRKADEYRRLASVTDYLLIAQDRVKVEHWSRRGEAWTMVELGGIDDSIRLDALGLEITLRQVYAKVSLPGGGA